MSLKSPPVSITSGHPARGHRGRGGERRAGKERATHAAGRQRFSARVTAEICRVRSRGSSERNCRYLISGVAASGLLGFLIIYLQACIAKYGLPCLVG